MPGNAERRPYGNGAALNTDGPAKDLGVHFKPSGLLLPVSNPLDAVAEHVNGAFVLVVNVTGGRYRRHCFLSAASAERAARNALEAGHNAEVFLAELKPLWKLAGGGQRD
jgi:hypothetical protein